MRTLRRPTLLALGLVSAALAGAHCGHQGPEPTVPPMTTATPPPAVAVATTPALASIDTSALDTTADPCTDFYQYACGGWMKSHPIPGDRSSWARFGELAEKNLALLRTILDKDAAGEGGDSAYAAKLGDFYGACMDAPGVELRAKADLEAELARIDAITDARSLTKALAHLQPLSSSFLFDEGAEVDAKDATQMIFALGQGGIGLPERDYYFDDPKKPDARKVSVRAAYIAHVTAMFALLGDAPDAAKAHAAAVMAIETKLAQASLTKEELRDPKALYHPHDRQWLKDNAGALAWDDYFTDLGIPQVQTVNVAMPEYIKAASDVVAHAKMADVRTYLRWHLVHKTARALPAAFVDEDFKYQQALGGAKTLAPRWKRCVRLTDEMMGEALAQPFVKETLGEEGKAQSKALVTGILGAMREDLAQVPWMDDATRASAIAKVGAILQKIGFPDRWRSYDALDVSRTSLVGNVLRGSAFEERRELAKLGKPVDRTEWGMTPPTVNAYYNPSINEIVFPAGILQPPFFGPAMTRAMRYGAIGAVIGHEVTHGFDDEGRQFDAKGNLVDWWSPSVGKEFDARAKCVSDEFDGFTVLGDVHVNGKLTLGEDIGDLGGLQIAHAAFVREEQDYPDNATYAVPKEQQFFTAFGQIWCSNMRDEALHTLVSTNPHAPPQFRVNGALANTPQFAKAFSCGAQSPMVRANQCKIW